MDLGSDDAKENVEEGFGICGNIIIAISYVLFAFTLPMSLFVSLRIVKEYERAVILRLGRILPGGGKYLIN
jgi:erythrocyte band 7 integral membrane protein